MERPWPQKLLLVGQHYLRESHTRLSQQKEPLRTPSQGQLLVRLLPQKWNKDTFKQCFLGHYHLGRAEEVCSMFIQKHSPPGHATNNCESNRDPVIQEEESVFKCRSCGKVFTRKHLLAPHKGSQSGVKQYECTKCGKVFSKSTYLLQYHIVNPREKPYKCMGCEKAFNCKSTSPSTSGSTVGRSLINVRSAAELSPTALCSSYITGATLEKNLLYVKNVGKLFEISQVSSDTTSSTMGRTDNGILSEDRSYT